MSKRREELKQDGISILQKLLDRTTVNQARWFSAIVTFLVLFLFVVTPGGRDIIVFLGYVGFVLCVLYGGYKLYKYTTANAKGVPKPKAPKPEIIDDEPPVEDDSVEFRSELFPDDEENAPSDEPHAEQMTIDDLEEEVESEENSQ